MSTNKEKTAFYVVGKEKGVALIKGVKLTQELEETLEVRPEKLELILA